MEDLFVRTKKYRKSPPCYKAKLHFAHAPYNKKIKNDR